ncbi:tumor necrosis factor receptor superfamily member 21 isoform X1 [Lates japonicus]|uniref:Tumor necrosis factor receptor superfamily member 21 isoform X1 n=1 Tax=Lates japonicus TaxID=270547 RepID=A0AAD3NFH9_LATJO|nr:tumor necrosis factor receptor superfamily member 21 isoform X1 [Lates japonicus]
MIVLLLLRVLVVIVVCSVKRSSRVLKKGPMQYPSSIMEKAIQKKPSAPTTQVKEKWIYYSNGQVLLLSGVEPSVDVIAPLWVSDPINSAPQHMV